MCMCVCHFISLQSIHIYFTYSIHITHSMRYICVCVSTTSYHGSIHRSCRPSNEMLFYDCSMKDTVRHIPTRLDKANIPSTFTGIFLRIPTGLPDFGHQPWFFQHAQSTTLCELGESIRRGSSRKPRFDFCFHQPWASTVRAMGQWHLRESRDFLWRRSWWSLMINSDGQGGPELKC